MPRGKFEKKPGGKIEYCRKCGFARPLARPKGWIHRSCRVHGDSALGLKTKRGKRA